MIVRHILDPVLKRQNSIPSRQLHYVGVFAFPQGTALSFFQLSTQALFICGWEEQGRMCRALCVGDWIEDMGILLFKQGRHGE